MIKIVFCLRRLASLSEAEFKAYWRDRHAPLVKEVAPALRIRRYVQSNYFSEPELAAAVDARGCALPPFDGVAELWWDSVEEIAAAGATMEGRTAGRRLLADEKNFIDLAQSSLFFTREHVVVGD